ncbi:hypothetical protein Pmani_007323 [Petrolisthes manimaculis]|uniref:Reverse transcriptase n=1 Tax=Petrolisthes manimaculis TaxID=1843537 RepID=A0AAE1UK81_9EUCA|nr:hypothetical protein Pmani_007323 [Petrolisthes manimaculis]
MTRRTVYLYDRGDYEQMRMEITEEWKVNVMSLGRTEEKWKQLKEKLKEIESLYVPVKHINENKLPKKYDAPIDQHTKEEVKKKNRCWQRYIETRDPEKYQAYTRQRNKVRKLTRKAQKDCEREIARESKANPKKFWRYVKNKLKTSTGIADLKINTDGETEFARTDHDKAKALSEFFAEVFTREPEDHSATILVHNNNAPMIPELVINAEEVRKQLYNLKIDKSPGPDSIHPRILKELRDELCDVLADLYNTSLREGRLPQEWKTANRWSEENLLPFHPDKCKHLKISSSRRVPRDTKYHLLKQNGTMTDIGEVDCEKDLGIVTDRHLTFEKHIQAKVNTANKIMGMIRRTFTALDNPTFRCLFKTMVRPHLEYAQSVWSPYRKKDVITIENVLRRASKLVPGLKDLTYPERLQVLGLPTMAYRRIRGDMIEVFKILNGHYDSEVNLHLEKNTGSTRGNSHKLFKERCRTKGRQMFFRLRIVDVWNSLPDDVIGAGSVLSFEKRLDKYWQNQGIKFNFDEKLVTTPGHYASLSIDENDLDIEA